MQMFDDLQSYVKQHHTTGVSWSMKGEPATLKHLKEKPKKAEKPGKSNKSAPAPPPPAGPAPPPPPPPAADFTPNENFGNNVEDNAANKMFDEINSLRDRAGAGLKKTYERDADGNKILVGDKPKTKGAPKPVERTKPKYGSAVQTKKPPRFECEGGKKWFVEHQSDNHKIEIEATMSQTVYIFKCEKSTIQIHGKCNSITVDNCKKINVVFDNAISQLEIVNCQSVKAQVMGKVPTVQVDKTDGFDMYLSQESIKAEFVTAKSSALNISVPMADDDFKEFAVPEQFKTIWDGKKFVTTTAEQ